MNRQRLLERFLRYVQIDTTAQADAEVYPSSPGQMELGRLLLAELQAMGLSDARQDQHGIVLATVPATVDSASAGNRLLLPPGHLAGDVGQQRPPAGDRELSRRRHGAARRSEPGDPRGRQPRIAGLPRPDAHHHRRHDPAGRRRQGGRGHHHGNGRVARRASRNSPRPGADLLHLRRGDRPRRGQARPGRDRRGGLLHARRPRQRARSTWRRFRPTRPW